MPFNSDSYTANKLSKSAWKHLADAREFRSRIQAGEAYDWEIPRLPLLVKMARWDMHRSIFFRSLVAPKLLRKQKQRAKE